MRMDEPATPAFTAVAIIAAALFVAASCFVIDEAMRKPEPARATATAARPAAPRLPSRLVDEGFAGVYHDVVLDRATGCRYLMQRDNGSLSALLRTDKTPDCDPASRVAGTAPLGAASTDR